MKITVNLDVTPQEARTFFGLPDVKPLQDEMLERIRDKMQAGVEGFDPVTLLKPFIPANMQSIESLQKAFWQGFSGKKDDSATTADAAAKGKKVAAGRS